MPIYEYECRACGHQFEFLLLPTAKETPACPECHGADLEKLPTGFALSTTELTKARVKKARAQHQSGKNFKDKQVAEQEHIQEHVREYMPEPPPKKKKQ
ncbi:MAG: zinc ribbon domain-containing protein [Acidimicrobiia bacterium]|nr:zinc ribbon domain-containing protein [Acidimicrobiia bacterium]